MMGQGMEKVRGSGLACWVMVLGLAALVGCSEDEVTGGGDAAGGSGGGGGAGGVAGGDPVDPNAYLDGSLRDQVAAAEAGALPCEGLLAAYSARITERDDGAEGINAIIAVDPEAESIAATLGEQYGQGALLQCAVIVVKDNVDMAGMVTTAGSLAMVNNVVDEDAPLVAAMRDAGALVLGKTNLSEWANFRGYGSTSGWSSHGGQTRNGANPDYNPCGSSSGSSAAVAAGLVSAAIGTETDGSISCPAAVNGVVGFKPTVGLVSRSGIVPISHTQDTAGPITRTVADAARLLGVMAGPDPQDPATAAIPAGLDLDFEAALEGTSLDGLRLGSITNLHRANTAVDAVFASELTKLEAAGAILVPVQLPTGAAYGSDELTVLTHEFKVGLNAYLASHVQPDQPATLAALIAYNEANASTVMPHFGQELFEQSEATAGLDAPGYLTAKEQAHQTTGPGGILAVMIADDLEALIAPSMGTAWQTDYAGGDSFTGGASFGPAAVAGYPSLTVPMGTVDGLPVGLSVYAGPWEDGKVLAIGHAYEQLDR